MRPKAHRRLARLAVATAFFPVPLLIGCGATQFASELPSRPRAIPLVKAEPRELHIPKDERFSIALAPTMENPGIGGQAEATGHAKPDGSADLTAGITNGGEAQAHFQLGHAFQNETEQQMDLDIVITFEYEYKSDALSEPGLDANIALRLYVRDKRNRLTRNTELFSSNNQRGLAERRGSDRVRFTLTVGPGEFVSVFLAGETTAKGEYGRSGACSLKLSNMQMAVQTKPAPIVDSKTSQPTSQSK